MTEQTGVGRVSEVLAQFISRTQLDDIPPHVLHEAKCSLMNFSACARGGRDAAVESCAAALRPFAGRPTSTVIGRSERSDALIAAFLNGASAMSSTSMIRMLARSFIPRLQLRRRSSLWGRSPAVRPRVAPRLRARDRMPRGQCGVARSVPARLYLRGVRHRGGGCEGAGLSDRAHSVDLRQCVGARGRPARNAREHVEEPERRQCST